jgi:hypothetical protein
MIARNLDLDINTLCSAPCVQPGTCSSYQTRVLDIFSLIQQLNPDMLVPFEGVQLDNEKLVVERLRCIERAIGC